MGRTVLAVYRMLHGRVKNPLVVAYLPEAKCMKYAIENLANKNKQLSSLFARDGVFFLPVRTSVVLYAFLRTILVQVCLFLSVNRWLKKLKSLWVLVEVYLYIRDDGFFPRKTT